MNKTTPRRESIPIEPDTEVTVPLTDSKTRFREPSKAKVLQFTRTVLQGIAPTNSELVSEFAGAFQILIGAYTRNLNHSDVVGEV